MPRFNLASRLVLAGTLIAASIGSASALDTSATGGAFFQKNDTTGGVIITQHLRARALHVPGFRSQISVALPLATGGRYGATAEVRRGFGGTTFVGAGVGYGKWDRLGRYGAMYDVLAGTRIANHTYLEGRIYNPITSRVGHTGFVGVTYFF